MAGATIMRCGVLEASLANVFRQCGLRWERAKILCKMGRFADAIETLRNATGARIDPAHPVC